MEKKKINIGRAVEAQYEELMHQLNYSFDFNNPESGFFGLLPKLYKREYKPWEKNICVFEEEKIVAAVGVYPSQFSVYGNNLTVGGVGNVAVCQEARGKGYMKIAMNAAVEDMIKSGVDFSILHGKRQRYQYFGYECMGLAYQFHVTRDSFRHALGKGQRRLKAEVLTKEDDKALDFIYQSNANRAIHSVRERESLYDLLLSWKARPYVLKQGEKYVGYFVMGCEGASVNEFFVAEEDLLPDAVAACMAVSDSYDIKFAFPTHEAVLCDFFDDICDWHETAEGANINIFHYQETLSAFLYAYSQEMRLPDFEMTCLIHGIAGDETLRITIRDNQTEVKSITEKPQIELSHLEAVRFFFGLFSPARRRFGSTNGILPLPFLFYSADCV